MSPTAMTPPPTVLATHHFRAPTSPTSRRKDVSTRSRSLTPSPLQLHIPAILGTPAPPTLADLPHIINTFDSMPTQLQSYLLLHLLRRCPARTLQFVSTLILPALKQDFLGDLPAELAYQILSHLDLRSLGRAGRVCKRWSGVVDGEGAGVAVWKGRLVNEGWWGEVEVKGLLERWVMWRRGVVKGGKGKEVVSEVVEEGEGVGLRVNTALKRSGESLNSCGTAYTVFGGGGGEEEEGVGLGLGFRAGGSFRSTTSTLRRRVEEEERDEDLDSNEDSQAESEFSELGYEFEEDEEEDHFDAAGDGVEGGEEFLEYFDAAHQNAALVRDTAEWMKTLDEFSTGLSADDASMFNIGSQSRRRRISRVRARLRQFIEECSKSELSQLALQIPHFYKSMYRRHVIIRRNWARGAHKTIEFPGHGSNVVTCLQFDNDKIVSGSDDQTIHIYETNSGRLRRKLIGHDGGVWALQYWGDSLVSGSTDRTVRVWDMDTGLCTHLFEGHTSTVRCLMIIPPTQADVYPFGTNGTGGVGFEAGLEPAQPLIVTGSRDASLRVWRLPNPKTDKFHVPRNAAGVVHTHEEDENNTYEEGTNPYFLHVLNGHTNSVRAIAGEGRVLVSGSYDCTVRVWDLVTGESVYTFRGHREKVYSVGYSHELGRAVSGSLDASVKVWCTRTGVLLHNLEGHTSLVGLLELSPQYLVSAAADQSLRIWNPETGSCLAHLYGHPAAITCFHHDPRLNRVVSGSDGGVKVWELSSVGGGSGAGVGPGFEFRQGPNGPEPVYGRFQRDLVSGIAGVWRVRMDERRLVCAVSKEGGSTWFQVLDFGENVAHGSVVQGSGDGGAEWMDDGEFFLSCGLDFFLLTIGFFCR
ncbi:SCF ubiquitin ligase complex subunit cdc4 [Podochytrium sp. JEL0797]|nr:SCF ubiquitin ligase complex subunit cdc4 [Podochytrium sp. JEL0797]